MRKSEKVPYLEIQTVGVDDVVVDNFDIKTTLLSTGQILDQFPQFRSTNAVRTVNSQAALDLDTPHDSLESLCKLLIITLLGRLAVLILCPKSVLAADDIVQLRRGHIFHVGKLDLCSGKCSIEHANQTGARCTSVPGEDHTSRVLHVNINLLDQFLVHIANLIQWSIGKLCRIFLPFSLSRVRERSVLVGANLR